MGKRRTTSRAVADPAAMATAPVPGCAHVATDATTTRCCYRDTDALPLLSIEALSLAMTIRDRTVTNLQLWSRLWQKQIIDKHQRGTAAVAASAGDYEWEERRG
jgi:hypothetical protein